MKVSNGRCVRRLAQRSLRASRTRNCIAVLAIALTTVLFTSLFTIAYPSTTDSSSPTSVRRAAPPTAGSST